MPRRTRSRPWSRFALPLAAWGLQDVLGPPLVAAGAGGPANAGGVLRGVVVASGHHLVRFAYRTPGEMRGRLAAAGGRLDQ